MVSCETCRVGSLGHIRLSVPEICWGDHFHSSSVSTTRQATLCTCSLARGRAASRRLVLRACAGADPYPTVGQGLRASSRLTVAAERPSVRAMARTLEPCCLMLAIVMRSSGWSCWYEVLCIAKPYTRQGVALQI